jgi:O-antigen/teichoic acid export membrane protein
MTAQSPSVVRRVAAGTGWVIAWRFISRNLGLLSTLILVRLLRPEDFGLVALATGFANTVEALSEIGVQDALVREPVADRDVYDTGFGLNLIRGGITAALILAIAWPTAAFFSEPRLVYVMLALGAAMFMSGFFNIGFVEFRRNLNYQKEFNLSVVSRLVMVLCTVTAAVIWRSYWALIFGVIMNRLCVVTLSYIMCAWRPRVSLRAWRRLIGFSAWSWVGTILIQIRDRGDSVIISRVLGTAQFGVFAIGSELGTLPFTELGEPLGRALFSGFALLHRDAGNPKALYLTAVEFAFALILPAGIGISMVADPMVRLILGTQWLAAVPVIQIIAITGTLSIFSLFSNMFLSASGHVREAVVLSTVSVLIRLPLMIALVLVWGLTGAALTFAIALAIDQALLLYRTAHRMSIGIMDLVSRVWRAVAASLTMIACLSVLGWAWTGTPDAPVGTAAADLATRCLTGAIAYAAALLLVWLLAGRPDGVERWLLTTILDRLRRPTIASPTEVGEVAARSDAGEGASTNPCVSQHPHPALRADLSRTRER